jgi:hypothetical protein
LNCDSGATSHMVSDTSYLTDVKNTKNFFVEIADGSRVAVTATGTLDLSTITEKLLLTMF